MVTGLDAKDARSENIQPKGSIVSHARLDLSRMEDAQAVLHVGARTVMTGLSASPVILVRNLPHSCRPLPVRTVKKGVTVTTGCNAFCATQDMNPMLTDLLARHAGKAGTRTMASAANDASLCVGPTQTLRQQGAIHAHLQCTAQTA